MVVALTCAVNVARLLLCDGALRHYDRDDVKERTSVVYTVILYLCEGADSTAFPNYPLADFAIPDFISADSTEVRNADAMKESIRLGLLEPEQYERWPVQFGDMVRARRPSAAVRPIHQLRRGVHVRCLFLPCCCVCAPRPSSRR